MVTKSQAYYLYYLGVAEKKEKNISGLAARLGVTMASASKMAALLEESGFITRESRELKLTQEGRELTRKLRQEHQILVRWMKRNHLAPHDTAAMDAYRYLIEMSRTCVEATLDAARKQDAQALLVEAATPCLRKHLPDGEYTVPFTVYKIDGTQPSMGNQGFYHPGRLIILDGRALLCLKAKTITYKNHLGLKLSGRLSAVEYWNGSGFLPLRKPHWFEEWQIPVCCPQIEQLEDKLVLKFPFQARASCGIANMPKSIALLEVEIK